MCFTAYSLFQLHVPALVTNHCFWIDWPGLTRVPSGTERSFSNRSRFVHSSCWVGVGLGRGCGLGSEVGSDAGGLNASASRVEVKSSLPPHPARIYAKNTNGMKGWKRLGFLFLFLFFFFLTFRLFFFFNFESQPPDFFFDLICDIRIFFEEILGIFAALC